MVMKTSHIAGRNVVRNSEDASQDNEDVISKNNKDVIRQTKTFDGQEEQQL
jgi:hypothetical protein